MKKRITILIFFMSLSMVGQDKLNQTIEEEACSCISEIDISIDRNVRYEKVKECIENEIMAFQLNNSLLKLTEKMKDTLGAIKEISNVDSLSIPQDVEIVINPTKNYKTIETTLLRNCSAMKTLMGNSEETSEVSLSDKNKALAFYNKGQQYFRNEKYENAIVEFNKAVKKDRKFAFAWDMLGFSYRKLENYKEAINCYNKSIKLDPKGRMPLMNKPIAYELMGDLTNAITSFKDFIKVFPDDPEGYYGIGRVYHLKGDLEAALDNTMKSYIMYNEVQSPYARDAGRNLGIFYNELKEKNNLDVFHRIAKKYKIQIE